MKRTLSEKENHLDNYNYGYVFSDKVFWGGFVLLLIFHCAGNTSVIYSDYEWLDWMYLVRNFVYLVMLFKIGFLTAYRKMEAVAVVCIFIIGFISVIKSESFGLFEFFLIMISAKDKEPRKIVAVFAWIKGIAILVTLFLAQIGILETLYYLDDAVGAYNTYGFCHRNVLGANVVVVCIAWFYLRYGKIKLHEVLVWVVISVITYNFALSRTSLIVMIITIVLFYMFQKCENDIRKIKRLNIIVLCGFVLTVIGIVVCTIIYNDEYWIWKLIDSIFTKRFYFANYCYEEYGFSIFGQNIPFVSSIEQQTEGVSKLILDSSYMRAILYYGIIPGGLMLTLYCLVLPFSIKIQDYSLLVALIIFAFYGISESYMIDVFYQFPLVIAWGMWVSYMYDSEPRKLIKVYWSHLACADIKFKPLKNLLMIKYTILWHMLNTLRAIKWKLTRR